MRVKAVFYGKNSPFVKISAADKYKLSLLNEECISVVKLSTKLVYIRKNM